MKRVVGIPLDPSDIQLANDVVRLSCLAGHETKRATLLRQLIRDGLPALRDRLIAAAMAQQP